VRGSLQGSVVEDARRNVVYWNPNGRSSMISVEDASCMGLRRSVMRASPSTCGVLTMD